jgi:hypothetical protein
MAFNSAPFQDYVPGWQRIWHGVRLGGKTVSVFALQETDERKAKNKLLESK